MRRWAKGLAAAAVAVALAAGGCGDEDGGGTTGSKETPDYGFNERRAFQDLATQIRYGPRPSGSRGWLQTIEFITGELLDAGAEGVGVDSPPRNITGTVGFGVPKTVIGAHYDTKDIPGFVGANDGASGVAVVLEIARVVRRLADEGKLNGTYEFVFFDGEEARGARSFEEDGTRGSRRYVAESRAGDIEAMFLLDMVGDCDLEIPREANSDEDLYALLDGPAFGGETSGILDDHIPFLEAGVPAVDLIDFDFGPGPSPGAWWHTDQDTIDKVCPRSLDQVGEAVLGALVELDD